MPLTVSATALGTPEAAWRECPRLAACPPMLWSPAGRVVVLAPHPDDEVLAVGGALKTLAASGAAVTIVAVTDGEASHPRSPTVSREQMARRRDGERATALDRLGLGAVEVVRLHFPDGAVEAAGSLLAHRLRPLLDGAAMCLAPWEHDGHPDHDAVGRAAVIACATGGVRLVQYPVWAWHWARPDTEDLPWDRVRHVALEPEVLLAKHHAIAAYRSQIEPLGAAEGDEAVLPAAVLERFRRPREVVFA
jgi:LmbE family N-acetylglucosaminyl deacetylase